MLKGLQQPSCKERPRELGLLSLERGLVGTHPWPSVPAGKCNKDRARLCSAVPNAEHKAAGTNPNAGGSLWTSGSTSGLYRWRSNGTGHPEVVESLPRGWSEASGHDVGHQLCLSSGQDQEISRGPFQSQPPSSWKTKLNGWNTAAWLRNEQTTLCYSSSCISFAPHLDRQLILASCTLVSNELLEHIREGQR